MFAVAIDGPSGAGKSSIAKAASEKLGFIYVDTGALYRTVGFYLLRNNILPENTAEVIANLPNMKIEMKYKGSEQKMFLCEEDVTDFIRTDEVSKIAALSSPIPEVRAFLLNLQMRMVEENNVIMDGRDIGTVVLPNAQVKIFLTASAEERARRRCIQMEESGAKVDFETVLKNIIDRDEQDMNRETSPLKQAEDAVLVDSTNIGKEETINQICDIIKNKFTS
jgi:cytidylate kinase